MKKLFKNWTSHHILGHPIMEIFHLVGFTRLGQAFHDATLPEHKD